MLRILIVRRVMLEPTNLLVGSERATFNAGLEKSPCGWGG